MAATDSTATGDSDPSEHPPEALIQATTALLSAVTALTLPLELPTADPARRTRAEIEHVLRTAVLPRLRTPDAPLLCALAGPTGVGKSTLLNALAGATLSATGALRPTTRTPVLVCHPADMAAGASSVAAEADAGVQEADSAEDSAPADADMAAGESSVATETDAGVQESDSAEDSAPADEDSASAAEDAVGEAAAHEAAEDAVGEAAAHEAAEDAVGEAAAHEAAEDAVGEAAAHEAAEDAKASADERVSSAGRGEQRGGAGLGARVGVELAAILSSPLPSPTLPRGIALVDTVDGDTAVTASADIVVVVVSAERYADAAVWRILRRVGASEVPVAVVLGRVSAGVVEEVAGAFGELLRVNGLGAVPFFVVEEVGGTSAEPTGDGDGARARGASRGDSFALSVDGGQGEGGAGVGGGAPGEGGYGDGGLGCAGERAGGTGVGDAVGIQGPEVGAGGDDYAGVVRGEAEAGTGSEGEAESGVDLEAEAEAADVTEAEAESADVSEAVAESADASAREADSPTAVAAEPDSESDSEVDSRSDSDSDSGSDSDSDSDSGIGTGAPLLPHSAAAELHGWLREAGADTAGRVRIGMLGVAGRLDSVDRLVGELADAWEGQRLALQVLHQGLERVHTAERVRFRGFVDSGELLGGEVRIRWQELLGSGRVSALFGAEEAGRKRGRRKSAGADWSSRFHNPTAHDAATAPLRAALVEAVARGYRAALERAARKTADQWELTPGAPETAPVDEATRRAIDPARAAAEWLDHLPAVILGQAHSRRTTRTIGPAGAHIRSAALVVGVAALAGSGIDAGAAAEGDAAEGDVLGARYDDPVAAAAIELLHTMFGHEHADRLLTTAIATLKDGNARLLDRAAESHRARLAAYTLDPRQAEALAEARAAVARTRNEEV